MNDTSKTSVTFLAISSDEAGQRLDNYLLRQLKGVPKSHIYRIVRSGEVRVNKGRVDVTYRLAEGDILRLPPVRLAEKPDTSTAQAAALHVEIPVLFEDEALIALNKPAGLAVHGGSGLSFGVIELLRAQRPQARFLELVHRLDRETSGILLVAKKRSALTRLHEMLRDNHQIDKRYLALVGGLWPHARNHVKLKLLKYETADGERRVRVSDEGLSSHTVINRRQVYRDCSLLECELKTGRTHQIRVHLAASGHAILGDDKYGDPGVNRALQKRGLRRMFLHAWRLTLAHPVSGDELALEAPLPEELQNFLNTLELA